MNMGIDISIVCNHLRKKDWLSGNFYLIPTAVIGWKEEDNVQSASASIKWMFVQLGIIITKQRYDYSKCS